MSDTSRNQNGENDGHENASGADDDDCYAYKCATDADDNRLLPSLHIRLRSLLYLKNRHNGCRRCCRHHDGRQPWR